jgi:hypothetical protein
LAWQFQLEGQKLKGVLLLQLALAWTASVLIWPLWWIQFRARRPGQLPPPHRLGMETAAVALVALTEHLGGLLSGVNGAPYLLRGQ